MQYLLSKISIFNAPNEYWGIIKHIWLSHDIWVLSYSLSYITSANSHAPTVFIASIVCTSDAAQDKKVSAFEEACTLYMNNNN